MSGRNQSGIVLLGVLLALFALAGSVLAFASMEYARLGRVLSDADRSRAFLLAEAGVADAGTILSAGTWAAGSALDWSDDGVDNDGDGRVDEGDEDVLVTVERWGDDGLDNDGDGAVDEVDEQVARVRARAGLGRVSQSVTGWFRQTVSDLPIPPAAIYVHDPLAVLRFQGNSFRIDGNDTNLDGTPGPTGPLHGVSINGSPSQVTSQLGGNQLDNVTGLGGFPSVGSWSPDDPRFIDALLDRFAPLATNVIQNHPGVYSGSLGDAASGRFEVTYSEGSLTLGGGSHGAGVLCVDGNLVIRGGWSFVGYVFVTGRVLFAGGGGNTRLMGALFVGGDVVEPVANNLAGLTLAGNIELLYSDEALRRVRTALSGYRLVAVSEP